VFRLYTWSAPESIAIYIEEMNGLPAKLMTHEYILCLLPAYYLPISSQSRSIQRKLLFSDSNGSHQKLYTFSFSLFYSLEIEFFISIFPPKSSLTLPILQCRNSLATRSASRADRELSCALLTNLMISLADIRVQSSQPNTSLAVLTLHLV